MPLLADGVYDLRIDKAEVKPTAAPGGKLVHLDLVTTDPSTSRTGQPLGAGIHAFDNVNTVPTGKASWEMVLRNVGALVQAAGLTPADLAVAGPNAQAQSTNADAWAPLLQGRVVRASIGYEPAGVSKAGKSFKEKNVIRYYTKKV